MRRARFVAVQLDAAKRSLVEARKQADAGAPYQIGATAAVFSPLLDAVGYLEDAVRALAQDAREHDHPRPTPFGGSARW